MANCTNVPHSQGGYGCYADFRPHISVTRYSHTWDERNENVLQSSHLWRMLKQNFLIEHHFTSGRDTPVAEMAELCS
jgi:hypothetical protein